MHHTLGLSWPGQLFLAYIHRVSINHVRKKTFFLVAYYANLHPAMSVGWSVGWSAPFLSSGPKGVDDIFFHTYGEFSPSPPPPPSLPPQISFSRRKFQSWGPNPVLRHIFQPWGPNPSLKAKILAGGPDPSLEAQISASRSGSGLLAEIWTLWLGLGPQGWDLGLQARILAFRLGFWPLG